MISFIIVEMYIIVSVRKKKPYTLRDDEGSDEVNFI